MKMAITGLGHLCAPDVRVCHLEETDTKRINSLLGDAGWISYHIIADSLVRKLIVF